MIESGRITYNKVLFIKSSEFSKTEKNNMRLICTKKLLLLLLLVKQKLQMEHKHMLLATKYVKENSSFNHNPNYHKTKTCINALLLLRSDILFVRSSIFKVPVIPYNNPTPITYSVAPTAPM